tara:strand:- start:389 stop:685 length:297 start_codon:yes stop_codon:yes gene_type:complete
VNPDRSVNRINTLCRFLSVTALLLFFGCDVSRQSQPGTGTRSTAEDTITLAADEVNLFGNSLTFPVTVSEIAVAIGPPDHVSQLANNLSTWDSVGLVV